MQKIRRVRLRQINMLRLYSIISLQLGKSINALVTVIHSLCTACLLNPNVKVEQELSELSPESKRHGVKAFLHLAEKSPGGLHL